MITHSPEDLEVVQAIQETLGRSLAQDHFGMTGKVVVRYIQSDAAFDGYQHWLRENDPDFEWR